MSLPLQRLGVLGRGLLAVLLWQWQQQRGWPMACLVALAGVAVASAAVDATWLATDALSGALWFVTPWLSWMLLALLLQGWLLAYRGPRLDREAGCTLLFMAPVPGWLVLLGRLAGGIVPLACLALVIQVADGMAARSVGLQPAWGGSLWWLAWGLVTMLAPALALLAALGAWGMAQGGRHHARQVVLLVLLVTAGAMIRLVLSWIMAEPAPGVADGQVARLAWYLRRWPGMVPRADAGSGVPAFPGLPLWPVACSLAATCMLLGMAWWGWRRAEFATQRSTDVIQEDPGSAIVRHWRPDDGGRWRSPALALLWLQGRLWRQGVMALGLVLAPLAVMVALLQGWPGLAPDMVMANGLLLAMVGMVVSALWTAGSGWPIMGLPGLPPQGLAWWFSWGLLLTLFHGACAWAGFCLGVWWTLHGLGVTFQDHVLWVLFGYGCVVAAWPLGGSMACGTAMLGHAPRRLRLSAGVLLAAAGALLIAASWRLSYRLMPPWTVVLGRMESLELRFVWQGLPQEPFWIMLAAGLLAWPGRCWLLDRRP